MFIPLCFFHSKNSDCPTASTSTYESSDKQITTDLSTSSEEKQEKTVAERPVGNCYW